MAKVNVPPKKKKKKPSSSTAPATLEPASDGTTSLDRGAESEAVSKVAGAVDKEGFFFFFLGGTFTLAITSRVN